MADNSNLYEPDEAAKTGERLDDLVRRALRLREHLWTASALWSMPDPGKPGQKLLDRENLLAGPEIGCYVCEESWTPRLARRRCSGESKPGPAPLLPGSRL